uniref:Uncharacterized protein n=1 Tax=Bos indicus x Bos taurus TaxID=30522 RepID=A0A4W2ET83_BOBOX
QVYFLNEDHALPGLHFPNSSCGSTEYPGETISHDPSLPTADPEHRWASFFSYKFTLLFMITVLESSEHSETSQALTGMITCDLAQEAVGKQQPGGQPGKTNCRPPS